MIRIKRESEVEKEVTRYAQQHNWLQYKFTSPGRRGVPDRLFISTLGSHVFIELKRPGEKPVPLQIREIERINRNKGTAGWFDNAKDAIQFLNDHIAPAAPAKTDDGLRRPAPVCDAHVWRGTGKNPGDSGRGQHSA